MKDRVNAAYRQGYGMPLPEIGGGYRHEPGFYIQQNLWTTSSGNYQMEALFCTRDALGKDRIMLGTDYPYEKMAEGVKMLVTDAPLSEEERAYYLYKNAKKLGFARNLKDE